MIDNNLFNAYEELQNKIRKVNDIDLRASSNMGISLLSLDIIDFFKKLCAELKGEKNVLIPNMLLGELSLCVEKYTGYSVDPRVKDLVDYNTDSVFNNYDFLQESSDIGYDTILLFAPIIRQRGKGRSEVLYLEKCLDNLNEGGRLIALIPQNLLSASAFKMLRERIISDFSIEAVMKVDRISNRVTIDCSIVIIENKSQSKQIFMSNNGDTNDLYSKYKNKENGFFVDSMEVYNRIDSFYYDPKYKEARELIRNKDTVKLSEIAQVFSGVMIPAEERKVEGDYLIIKPRSISNSLLHLNTFDKSYCTKEFINNDRHGKKSLIKKGDILVSLIGDINWMIYDGDDGVAVANQHVAIVRGNLGSEEWINNFFKTKTGIKYLESQLKFFSHCGVFNHISILNLKQISVPNQNITNLIDAVTKEVDLESKVASLFKELGWNIQESYKRNDCYYDLALFEGEELKGVVEIKQYKAERLRKDIKLSKQLSRLKKNIGDANVYLFVDNEIFEYEDGMVLQLLELPRPNSEPRLSKKDGSKHSDDIIPLNIVNDEEKSISDQLTMEKLFEKFDSLSNALIRVEGKIDNISEKIDKIAEQITGYQSLVEKQIDLALTPDEVERIIHAFSEECVERIQKETIFQHSIEDYDTELIKLKLSFGDNAWNKMSEESQRFLASSKVMFNNLIKLDDIVDYSGVCLLVTKALEVEMSKRFCKNFIAYLKKHYPGKSNHSKFPTALLDRHGHPIRPKHFTLGTVAYVLCYLQADGITEEQVNNNKDKLLEYTKKHLFNGKTNEEILELLIDYAEDVESVKNDYRNPSAHTNVLKRIDAEECFNLVIDVEKILKRMLDSFDE